LDPSVGIAGATDRLSKTLTGMISNMADAFTRMKAAIGDFINMRGVVETLTGAFEKLGEKIRQASETPFETSIRHLQEMGVETTKLELTQAKLLKTRLEENGATGDLVKAEGDLEVLMEMRKETTKDLARERQRLIEAGMSEQQILDALEGIEASRAINSDRLFDSTKKSLDAREEELLAMLKTSKILQERLDNRNEDIKKAIEALGLETEYAAQLAKILGLEESISEKKKEQTSEAEKLVALTKEQQALMLEGEKMSLQLKEEMLSAHFDKVLSLANKNIESRKQAELQALR
ncbi:MAG: hypothetical protein VXA61_05965, partial [Candidatus Neomarinimicrobiota bacterium]